MQKRKASALFTAVALLATASVSSVNAEDAKSDIRIAYPIDAVTPYGYVVTIGPNEKSDGTLIQTVDYKEHSMLTCRFSDDDGRINVFASYHTPGFRVEVGAARYFQNARQNILKRVKDDRRVKDFLTSALGDSDYKMEVKFNAPVPVNGNTLPNKVVTNYTEQTGYMCEDLAKQAHERVLAMAAGGMLSSPERN